VVRRYGEEIAFVGVAWRDTEAAMAGFIEVFDLGSFRHVNDGDESLFAHLGVPYQPAWVFVDSKGEAVRSLGALPESDLERILAGLAVDRLPAA
jgi:hypothetical protein